MAVTVGILLKCFWLQLMNAIEELMISSIYQLILRQVHFYLGESFLRSGQAGNKERVNLNVGFYSYCNFLAFPFVAEQMQCGLCIHQHD